jgi:hypothetical protein
MPSEVTKRERWSTDWFTDRFTGSRCNGSESTKISFGETARLDARDPSASTPTKLLPVIMFADPRSIDLDQSVGGVIGFNWLGPTPWGEPCFFEAIVV